MDRLDLSALFAKAGYHGSRPGMDGYLRLTADGHGGTDVWFNPAHDGGAGTMIADLSGVAPASINVARDVNFGQFAAKATPPSSAGSTSSVGQILAAPNDSGSAMVGGAGADTLVASHGADTLTGAAGSDTFRFPVVPWSAGHITDFNPTQDVLDLTPLFQADHYQGTNPTADHHLSFVSDGHGDTLVYFSPTGSTTGHPWPYLVTTLDHVSPSQITSHDFLF